MYRWHYRSFITSTYTAACRGHLLEAHSLLTHHKPTQVNPNVLYEKEKDPTILTTINTASPPVPYKPEHCLLASSHMASGSHGKVVICIVSWTQMLPADSYIIINHVQPLYTIHFTDLSHKLATWGFLAPVRFLLHTSLLTSWALSSVPHF